MRRAAPSAACVRAALGAALMVCWLANTPPCWPLSDSSLVGQTAAERLAEGRPPRPEGETQGERQSPTSLYASLQLALGRNWLRLSALQYGERGGLAAGPMPAQARPLSPRLAMVGGEGEAIAPLSRAHSSRASAYRLSYAHPRFEVSGSLTDVGARFSPAAGSELSEEEAALRQALGTQALNLNATWHLGSGASLTSERNSTRHDRFGDEQRGATITDTTHLLALALGKGASLKASLRDHEETWDPWLGKPDQRRRTTAVELASAFGAAGQHDLRLALTTVASQSGREARTETTQEAHLALRPTGRLGLAADCASKTDPQGRREDTRQVSATLQLPVEGQLVAALKRVAPEAGPGANESSFQLNTSLGGGASTGKLWLQQTVAHAGESGRTTKTNLSLSGSLGSGGAAANLSLKLEEARSDGWQGSWTRNATFHLDRALGPRWKLTADSQERITGTNAAPHVDLGSRLSLAGELGPRTRLKLGLGRGGPVEESDGSAQHVTLEQEWAGARLRTEYRPAGSAPQASAVTGYGIELPRGALPGWASSLPTAHEFSDAREFLAAHRPPPGLEAPFAGSRLVVRRRSGGPDDGKDTICFSHGMMLLGRRYLQLEAQRFPEATEGDQKGRPMDLERRAVMLGSPLAGGLTGRLWLAAEESLSDPESHRRRAGLAIWGRLGEQDQLEASVSRDSERWAGADRDRTTVSVLFSRKVNEENKLHLKVGYSWGEQAGSGDTERDYRVSLGYEKPI